MALWDALLGLFVLLIIIIAVLSRINRKSFNSVLSDFFDGLGEVFKRKNE